MPPQLKQGRNDILDYDEQLAWTGRGTMTNADVAIL